jgi:thymidylate synthase
MELFDSSSSKISDNIFNSMQKSVSEEYQYLNLIENVLENGFWEEGRNGRTQSIFGASMRFSLENSLIPILTTKKTAWKTCLKELLWFVRGETDTQLLKDQNVHIWDANTSRDFLDSRGLKLYPEGMAGPIYGYQWRYFGANYNCFSGRPVCDRENSEPDIFKNCLTYKGVDQLQQIIDDLKDPLKRNSRRHIMTAWSPTQIDKMALPPCHILCQFNVHDGNKLSCALYQRSADIMLGVPFNIASYSFLTHLIAKHCDLEPYEFIHFIGNAHIYEDHIESAKTQILREPYDFATLEISTKRDNINDYLVEDFIVNDYKNHEAIKMKMVA